MARSVTVLLAFLLAAACGSDGAEGDDGMELMCGENPAPPGAGSCPEICTGGCDDGTCTIQCEGFAACDVKTIECPDDYACLLVCDGGDSCDTSTVECANGYACEIDCVNGTDACGDLIVNCNDASTCTMNCRDVPEVCVGALINCGAGECAASCEGGSRPETVCGESCSCTEC